MARKIIGAAIAALVLASAGAASAGPYGDDLGKCFVRSTSAEDKRVLMRWIFGVMALNPGVKPLTNISDTQRDEANRLMGALTQRLFTVDCRKEAVAALKYEGTSALEGSFELLGRAATAELMSDPDITAHAGDFGKYIDQAKFAEVLKEAGMTGGGGKKSPL